jgi:hypothetical protein
MTLQPARRREVASSTARTLALLSTNVRRWRCPPAECSVDLSTKVEPNERFDYAARIFEAQTEINIIKRVLRLSEADRTISIRECFVA